MQNKDLFDKNLENTSFQPLAEKMRPKNLEEYVGQEHILGKGKPLRMMVEKGNMQSIILWGPPGSGKTSLAQLVAHYTKSHFEQFSAVTAGVADVRRVTKQAADRLKFNSARTILFVDEIHRFNKAQQDAFLPYVENGTIILIGATTENPSFEVNAPLISRLQVFVLNALKNKDLEKLIRRALLYFPKHKFEDNALEYIVQKSNGDARTALNAIELATNLNKKVTLKIAEEAVQQKAIYYDKKGDWHYDVISAFIKSMRGSNPDASLYWLARMIKAGEDPVFIARRMVIFASEDVSNAAPTALVLATATMQAVHMVGMPEAGIILAQCATYLATAPKSRASYNGLVTALKDIDEKTLEPVPLQLRNAATDLMKDLGYGKDYKWTDDKEFQETIEFMPENLKGKKYYFPPKKD
ncbi:MAG: replication-associated recombination protein A [Patescibacteria group bacterium]